jgi:hypothetical protein
MPFGPFRLSACPQVKMAFFRTHNASIAGSQFAKAIKTIPLTKRFTGIFSTMDAVDYAINVQRNFVS